jgi:ribulokinase
MANYFLGLDLGTGGCKAALIDDQCQEMGYAFREYPIITEKPGWSEHDPQLYWQYTCEMFKEVLAKVHIQPSEIKCIAVSCALPAMVMIDRQLNPVNRSYNLMDRRAKEEVIWAKEHVGAREVYNKTGYRLDDHPSIINLLWEKHNRPDSFARIYKAVTMSGYIVMKLTGRVTCNRTETTLYGSYDLRKERFDPEIHQKMGVDLNLFPDIFPCTEIIGEVTNEAAGECGLAAGIPVTAGQADANASWIGAGAIEIGDFQSNLGTVGNFGVIHNDFDFVSSEAGYQMGITIPYTLPGTLVTIPTTLTGGQCLRFLRDTIAQAELQTEHTLGVSVYDLFNLQAAKIPPGSEGLIILPTLMGERAPTWDSHARSVFFGLSLNHTKGHIIRAMMEGVAYAMYHSFSIMRDSGIKINFPMVLNEGGAVSKLWRQIITDVFNIPTVMVKRRTGAPYGDAILAGVAVGIFKDFSIAKEKTEYVDHLEPNMENHRRYEEYFSLYKKIYQDVKEDFKILADLREKA